MPDSLCLTVNDFIQLPEGNIVQYRPINEDLGHNRDLTDDTILRLDNLKDDNYLNDFEVGSAAEVNNDKDVVCIVNEVKKTDENEFRGERPATNRNRLRLQGEVIPSSSQGTASSLSDSRSVSNSDSMQDYHKPLPPGKLYHVFFSHCSDDREWVRRSVEKLESPEYGFKCCHADRDFDLGVPVFQNITKCIHSSKRTVIVLSPEFLESPWCGYETRITLEMDMDTRQRLLIPIMLRSCCIPQYIGRLTYMEVENEHFWDRFVAALQKDGKYRFPCSFNWWLFSNIRTRILHKSLLSYAI